MKVGLLTIMSFVCLVSIPSPIIAQPVKTRFHKEPYFVDSGVHDGLVGQGAETFAAFRDVIRVPGAPWIRLEFQTFNFGEMVSMHVNMKDSTSVVSDSMRSYITITSLKDGGKQILDAISLKQWRNTSAYFNGDAVEIELHVAPGDKGVFFQISNLYIGEQVSDMSLDKALTLCGLGDGRESFTDPAVGRVLAINWGGWNILAYCTGWIASNGAYLTAGHCVDIDTPPDGIIDMDVLEFKVPASNSNGTPNFSHPDDQYPID